MDEFSYLSVLLSVILGLAVTQILKGFRGLLLSRAHSALLAGDCLGGAAAAGLFSTLVGDLWNANQARLDFSPIRDGASQCDFYLYGRGPGLPGLFWGRSCRSKRKFLSAPRLVLLARLRRGCS